MVDIKRTKQKCTPEQLDVLGEEVVHFVGQVLALVCDDQVECVVHEKVSILADAVSGWSVK